MCLGKKPKVKKAEPPPPPPADNSVEVGDAELRRKRAAAAAQGRQSTIATSGLGVVGSGSTGQKVGS